MKTKCATYAESLVRLAEGRQEEAAREHVAGCTRCAARLDQLKAMLSLAEVRHYDAPRDLIQSVKGLVAPRQKVIVATLLRSSLALSGARSLPETAQLIVGTEEHPIRLMIRQQGEGYELFGELPSEDWTVESDCEEVSQDGPRFRMLCMNPSQTGFTAEADDLRIEVPALEELLSSGTQSAG